MNSAFRKRIASLINGYNVVLWEDLWRNWWWAVVHEEKYNTLYDSPHAYKSLEEARDAFINTCDWKTKHFPSLHDDGPLPMKMRVIWRPVPNSKNNEHICKVGDVSGRLWSVPPPPITESSKYIWRSTKPPFWPGTTSRKTVWARVGELYAVVKDEWSYNGGALNKSFNYRAMAVDVNGGTQDSVGGIKGIEVAKSMAIYLAEMEQVDWSDQGDVPPPPVVESRPIWRHYRSFTGTEVDWIIYDGLLRKVLHSPSLNSLFNLDITPIKIKIEIFDDWRLSADGVGFFGTRKVYSTIVDVKSKDLDKNVKLMKEKALKVVIQPLGPPPPVVEAAPMIIWRTRPIHGQPKKPWAPGFEWTQIGGLIVSIRKAYGGGFKVTTSSGGEDHTYGHTYGTTFNDADAAKRFAVHLAMTSGPECSHQIPESRLIWRPVNPSDPNGCIRAMIPNGFAIVQPLHLPQINGKYKMEWEWVIISLAGIAELHSRWLNPNGDIATFKTRDAAAKDVSKIAMTWQSTLSNWDRDDVAPPVVESVGLIWRKGAPLKFRGYVPFPISLWAKDIIEWTMFEGNYYVILSTEWEDPALAIRLYGKLKPYKMVMIVDGLPINTWRIETIDEAKRLAMYELLQCEKYRTEYHGEGPPPPVIEGKTNLSLADRLLEARAIWRSTPPVDHLALREWESFTNTSSTPLVWARITGCYVFIRGHRDDARRSMVGQYSGYTVTIFKICDDHLDFIEGYGRYRGQSFEETKEEAPVIVPTALEEYEEKLRGQVRREPPPPPVT